MGVHLLSRLKKEKEEQMQWAWPLPLLTLNMAVTSGARAPILWPRGNRHKGKAKRVLEPVTVVPISKLLYVRKINPICLSHFRSVFLLFAAEHITI